MAQIGYHASHEQFKPSELLKYVQMAEQAGFTHALSSDHFHQWRSNIFKSKMLTQLITPD